MSTKVTEIILETLRELNADLHLDQLEEPTPQTRLYGEKSGLDSIALVTLIADLEEKVAEAYGIDLVLADERAMSQTRSPFRRVESLAEHIEARLREEGVDP